MIQLPRHPLPIALSYAWGCYTLGTNDREAKSIDPFEALTILGMTDVQARSAMRLAKQNQGEVFAFSWEKH